MTGVADELAGILGGGVGRSVRGRNKQDYEED
jgi:hypothetical protein